MLDERPDADLLIHPECGCASQCMYAAAQDADLARRTQVLSTEGMVNHVARSPKRDFVVATETGILHRLTRESPDKRFYAMSERAVCRYMKMITLREAARRPARHAARRHRRPGGRRPRPRRDHPHGRDRLAIAVLDPRADRARVGPALPGRLARRRSPSAGSGWPRPAPGAAQAIAEHRAAAEDGVVLVGAAGTYDTGRHPIGSAIIAGRCAATASAPVGRRAPLRGRARLRVCGRDRAGGRGRSSCRSRRRPGRRRRPPAGTPGIRPPPARRWRATLSPWPPGSSASSSPIVRGISNVGRRPRPRRLADGRGAGGEPRRSRGGWRDEAAPRPLDLPQRHVRVPRDPGAADRPARTRVRAGAPRRPAAERRALRRPLRRLQGELLRRAPARRRLRRRPGRLGARASASARCSWRRRPDVLPGPGARVLCPGADDHGHAALPLPASRRGRDRARACSRTSARRCATATPTSAC